MDPATAATTILTGLALGAVYGAYGFLTKREPGEGFEMRKLARTTFVWSIAGAIVALEPTQSVSEGTVGEKAAAIGAVGIFIDQLWIYLEKRSREEGW